MKNKLEGFVLSTGRTGTVSLANILNTASGVYSIHEPKPSRRYHIYSRLVYENKLEKRKIAEKYFKHRIKLIKKKDFEKYIEVNPFFWMAGQVLGEHINNLRILHITRDIKPYIKSRINFGAHGWHRWIIDFIPFYHLNISKYHVNDKINWEDINKFEKIAWRWVFFNRIIEENSKINPYLRIRFEDIFMRDKIKKEMSLIKISDFFKIKLKINDCLDLINKIENPSKKFKLNSFEQLDENTKLNIYKITHQNRKQYGYIQK